MGVLKCTMIIQQATGTIAKTSNSQRLAGWSESWIDASGETRAVKLNNFRKLCQFRAAMLCSTAVIVGQRYQELDPKSASFTDSRRYPGNTTFLADTPDLAMYCRAVSVDVNTRPVYFRGLPDNVCVDGEIVRGGTWEDAFNAFNNWVRGYSFRGKAYNNPLIPIQNIVSGLVTTNAAHGVTAGATVKIIKTVGAAGSGNVTGLFKVNSVPTIATLTLVNFNVGTWNGGNLQLQGSGYHLLPGLPITLGRVVRRKVGRPSEQYRGRASKRA